MIKPWTSTFEDSEDRLLDIALAASPQQRLEWLEEAQRFALESGILDAQRAGSSVTNRPPLKASN